VLNQPIEVIGVEETTALGAAVAGGLGAGIYRDASAALAALEYSRTVVEPDPNLVDLYNTRFRQVHQRLYNTLRDIHHVISDLEE
jgi:xylulokinase